MLKKPIRASGGIGISREEKDNIYKAIKEVEARIASLKKAIE